MLTPNKLNNNGFTLIELIVVIAILGILAIIAIPRLSGYVESTKQADDRNLAAVFANSAALYLAGNRDVLNVADVAGAPGSGIISENDLVVLMAATGLLDSTYISLDDIEVKMMSNEYRAAELDIKYNGSVVTVVLTGITPAFIYTIQK